MAACLLMRSTNINKVAEQSGFNNYSYFYKIFIKQMGCSPAEYRKRLETREKPDRPLPDTKPAEISTETAC